VSYEIEFTRRAEKEILKLDAAMFEQIRAVIDSLGDNPRPLGVRKLRGRESEWRIRVGRFRVLYTIHDATRRILVYRVTDRKDVYRR
jgi:mRNA interferase RelE/StbE